MCTSGTKTGIHVALNAAPSIQKARVRHARARGQPRSAAPAAAGAGAPSGWRPTLSGSRRITHATRVRTTKIAAPKTTYAVRQPAALDEPLHDGRVARDVRGPHAERRDAAVEQIGLPELGHERHAGERRAQEQPARADDDARAPEISEPPRGEAEDAVERRVEGERARQGGPAPAELLEQRREENAERVLGAVREEEDEERAPDDDPAPKQDQARPFLPLSFGRTSARNLPVYEPGVCATASGVPSATISPPSSPPSGPRSITWSAD